MGKCNKVMLKKLLCEFLACCIIQFIGCSLPDGHTASFATKRSSVTQYTQNSIIGKFQNDEALRAPSSIFGDDVSIAGIGTGGSMAGVQPSGTLGSVRDYIGFSHVPVLYGFAWGGAVMTFTQAFRIVSGAHFNPAITLASMLVKNISVFDGLMYILVQVLGTSVGHSLVWVTFMPSMVITGIKFCATRVRMDQVYKAVVLEFFLTTTYVFAMLASWHKSNQEMLETISLRIGLVVTGAIMVGAPHTMTCMNPFRSLLPAITGLYFAHIYVYLCVPFIAAALMALFWRFLILQNKDETVRADGTSGGGGGGVFGGGGE